MLESRRNAKTPEGSTTQVSVSPEFFKTETKGWNGSNPIKLEDKTAIETRQKSSTSPEEESRNKKSLKDHMGIVQGSPLSNTRRIIGGGGGGRRKEQIFTSGTNSWNNCDRISEALPQNLGSRLESLLF